MSRYVYKFIPPYLDKTIRCEVATPCLWQHDNLSQAMVHTYTDAIRLCRKTMFKPHSFIKETGENRLISHNVDKEQYPDIIPDERKIDTIGIVLGKGRGLMNSEYRDEF